MNSASWPVMLQSWPVISPSDIHLLRWNRLGIGTEITSSVELQTIGLLFGEPARLAKDGTPAVQKQKHLSCFQNLVAVGDAAHVSGASGTPLVHSP